MFLRELIVSGLAVIGFSQSSVSVTSCSGPDAKFSIDSLAFSPSIPVPGTSGTLITSYTVPSEINSGVSRYTCTLNGLPVFDEKCDLCTQTVCPIKTGAHTDKSISEIPNTTGKVICKISWANSAGSELMCIQITMKLVGFLRRAGAMHGISGERVQTYANNTQCFRRG